MPRKREEKVQGGHLNTVWDVITSHARLRELSASKQLNRTDLQRIVTGSKSVSAEKLFCVVEALLAMASEIDTRHECDGVAARVKQHILDFAKENQKFDLKPFLNGQSWEDWIDGVLSTGATEIGAPRKKKQTSEDLLAKHKYGDAVKHSEKVLQMNKGDVQASINFIESILYSLRGNRDEAWKKASTAMTQIGKWPPEFMDRLQILQAVLHVQKPDASRHLLSEAADILEGVVLRAKGQDLALAKLHLGVVLCKTGAHKKAKKHLNDVCTQAPPDLPCYLKMIAEFRLATLYVNAEMMKRYGSQVNKKDLDQALTHYLNALQLAGDEYKEEKGRILYSMGDLHKLFAKCDRRSANEELDQGVQTCWKAIRLFEQLRMARSYDYGNAQYNIGDYHLQRKRPTEENMKEAIQALECSLAVFFQGGSVDDESAEVLYLMSRAYHRLSKIKSWDCNLLTTAISNAKGAANVASPKNVKLAKYRRWRSNLLADYLSHCKKSRDEFDAIESRDKVCK